MDLSAVQLQPLRDREAELPMLKDADFAALWHGGALPMLALGDGDPDPDGFAVPALEGDVEGEGGLALPPLPPIRDVEERELAPRSLWCLGYHVRFDGCSHSSGEQRGYVNCPMEREHGDACIKYSQVNQHGNWQECAAWLACWITLGSGSDNKADHLAYEPWPEAVKAAMGTIVVD